MSTPVLKLGVRIPRADAFALNQSALGPLLAPIPSAAEQEAAGHWLLGSDFDSGSNFPDLLTGQLLTKTGTVTINSNNVSLGVGTNLLTSPIVDATPQTICAVVQQQAFAGLTIGQGALICGYDNGSTAGSAFYVSNSGSGPGYYAVTRPGTAAPEVQILSTPSSTGNYIFLAMSHAPQVGPTPPTRTVLTSPSSSPIITTTPFTKTPGGSGHFVQLGGTQISTPGALVAAELIVFNKYLTAAQLAAVYSRSVARMAARPGGGITLV